MMSTDFKSDESVIDAIARQLIETERLTLKDRINGNIIDLFNYNKHDGQKGRKTGEALLINQVPNLTVIDIDINKSLNDSEKEKVRNNLLKMLDINDVIVKTASGGLHIYCNTELFSGTCNRMIKCYTSSDFDIDIMTTIDENKRSLIVLPESKVRKDHKSPISTYKFIKGSYESTITRDVNSVLNDLNVKIMVQQEQEINEITNAYQECNLSDDVIELIIDGLSDLEIHNDGGNRRLNEEITLFTLFQAINSLPANWASYAYDYVYENCNLTDNARSNYESQRSRYSIMKTSPYVLIKILKIYKNDYYNEFIKPMLNMHVSLCDIDLNEDFDMNTMIVKAEKHEYKNMNDVLVDLSKVIRRIDSDSIMYVKKIYDIHSKRYTISFVNQTTMKDMLKSIRLWKDEKKYVTAWNVVEQNAGKLSVKGVKFNTDDKQTFYCHFHGYKYNILDSVNVELIQPFLNFINEVICDNNEDVYKYVLGWIATMLQNPGKKNETALILKGLQGIGKNRFTDVLCELTSGYSERNITDIQELTGSFNSVVENKMLLILNELRNFGEDRMVNFNSLKSIITDDTIRINEKNQPRRTAENVANFIFVSNNSYPVKIELGDRRYVVLQCNGKYKGQFEFFKQLVNSFTNEFYDNLLTFFVKYDISTFNVRELPMTEAKEDLIEASRNPLDIWICEHYNQLCTGMLCTDALTCKPSEMKERTFQLQIKDKCDRKQKQIDCVRKWCYVLKDECKTIYKQTNSLCMEDEYVEDDEIPTRGN